MAQPARSMGFFSDMMSKLKQDPELKKALDELEKSDAAEAARTAMEKAKEGVAAASDGLDTAQEKMAEAKKTAEETFQQASDQIDNAQEAAAEARRQAAEAMAPKMDAESKAKYEKMREEMGLGSRQEGEDAAAAAGEGEAGAAAGADSGKGEKRERQSMMDRMGESTLFQGIKNAGDTAKEKMKEAEAVDKKKMDEKMSDSKEMVLSEDTTSSKVFRGFGSGLAFVGSKMFR